MAFLVTGGAGFIGSNVVDRLLALNHEVIVLDDFSLGKIENLSQHRKNKNLKIVKKSICGNLEKVFNSDIQAVFHLAALPRVQFSIQKPVETHNANVNGTLNLLNHCKKSGVKRFIFSSSSSVYGDQKEILLNESMKPNPLSPYALHKLVGEQYCSLFNTLFGIEAISLRYFNVYGQRQNPEGNYACLIPKFIKLIHAGEKPVINGNGDQTRDFTFVEDVVEANILAMQTKNKACFAQAFNIGFGKNHSVNEVTKMINSRAGKNIAPIHGPAVIEPKHTLADISKAKEMLGWKPKTALDNGLEKTFAYFTQK